MHDAGLFSINSTLGMDYPAPPRPLANHLIDRDLIKKNIYISIINSNYVHKLNMLVS